MNYFELFEIPVTPVVDGSKLAKKYFELQRESHPDFHSQATEIEKENSLNRSATINKAFVIFKDPQQTLEYFLTCRNVITENEKYELTPAFLMEMLELNEELATESPALIIEKIAAVENELKQKIVPILGKKDAVINEAEVSALKDFYYKKKYLERILARLGD